MPDESIEKFDSNVIWFLRNYADKAARIAFFVIFFWFGILKLLGLSPAGPLVKDLLSVTFLEGLPPQTFNAAFGVFEMIVGIMALIPRLERVTFLLMGLHLATTILPLFLLPDIAWQQTFVPTLTGQYIMKNLALISLGMVLLARMKPMSKTHSFLGEESDKI
jgi:uncharacterized membrane protein YkgB